MLTLVTGATGLVGNNVVRLLLARGQAVRVLARESADTRPLAGLDVQIVRGDVRDDAAVRQAVDGVQQIVHAAGLVQIGSKVTIKEQGFDPETYIIVGAAEANPREGKISNESPIGKAILGHRHGEEVNVETPSGTYKVKIVKVS